MELTKDEIERVNDYINHKLKLKINEILFICLPENTSLKEMEKLACRLYGEICNFVNNKI